MASGSSIWRRSGIRRWSRASPRRCSRVREEPGRPLIADALRPCQGPQAARRARQLRAPGRGVRASRQCAAAERAGRPDPRDQPRGAAHSGRADLPGAAARGARAQGRRRGPSAFRSRAAVRRARAAAEAELRSDRARGAGGRRALRPARGHPAGARAGGGAAALDVGRRDQRAAQRSLQAADRRQSRGAGAPADAARARRVVVRSPARKREGPARPAERFRRRLRSRRRRGGLRRRAPLAADDVLDLVTSLVEKSLVMVERLDDGSRYGMLETIREFARGHLAGQDEPAIPLRDAGDDPGIRARAARRARRPCRLIGAALRLLPGRRQESARDAARTGAGGMDTPDGSRARQSPRRHRAGACRRRRPGDRGQVRGRVDALPDPARLFDRRPQKPACRACAADLAGADGCPRARALRRRRACHEPGRPRRKRSRC